MMNISSAISTCFDAVAPTVEEIRPKVSIVLPVYNGARYLENAIKSCLSQVFKDLELIIVDDASTDETSLIAERYSRLDTRVRLLRHEVNKKLPAALNTGFAVARGEFLTWTSDDNCYRPTAVAAMLDFLSKKPDVDIVYADYTAIDSSGDFLQQVSVSDPIYLVRENIAGPCFLYRRIVQERVGGYDESLFLVEDYDFWLQAAAFFRMASLHQDLYLYRRHETSLSQRNVPTILCNHEMALRKNLPKLSRFPAGAVAVGWMKVAIMAKRRRDYFACLTALVRALIVAPFRTSILAIRIVQKGPMLVDRLFLS